MITNDTKSHYVVSSYHGRKEEKKAVFMLDILPVNVTLIPQWLHEVAPWKGYNAGHMVINLLCCNIDTLASKCEDLMLLSMYQLGHKGRQTKWVVHSNVRDSSRRGAQTSWLRQTASRSRALLLENVLTQVDEKLPSRPCKDLIPWWYVVRLNDFFPNWGSRLNRDALERIVTDLDFLLSGTVHVDRFKGQAVAIRSPVLDERGLRQCIELLRRNLTRLQRNFPSPGPTYNDDFVDVAEYDE